jgi:hypothetical protein
MLAKLSVLLPFELTVPLGGKFTVYGYEEGGYSVQFDLPSRSDKQPTPEAEDKVLVNGVPAIQADVISITFGKETFSREIASPVDPPEDFIRKTLRGFLERLKYVTKSERIKLDDFPNCQWTIRYLNDNGTELEKDESRRRALHSRKFSFAGIGCDPALWDMLFTLPPDFEGPPWHTLLLDAKAALPHVGTALVLAATALEVFIEELLNRLANATPIPGPLWNWINDRGEWQKQPSVEEQFDLLLKVLTGHSLKENNDLWEGFRHLRKARNSFVHEGVAKMLGGTMATLADAGALVSKAEGIISKVREWIPEQDRWPVFESKFEFQFQKQLIKPAPDEKGAEPDDAPHSQLE